MNGRLGNRRNWMVAALPGTFGTQCLYGVLAVCVWALIALPVWGATSRSWDDDGNSVDKNWSTAANWDPYGVPGIGLNVNDTVWIGDHTDAWHDVVQLDLDGVNIWNLTLMEGVALHTNDRELVVNNHTVLTGGTGLEATSLVVQDNGAADSFDTNTMDVVYGGRVELQGGVLEVDAGPLFIDVTSRLSGWGRVDLEHNDGGSGTEVLTSGTLAADGGNLLIQIAGSGNGLIRLGANSMIAAGGGDLTFHGDNWQYLQIVGAHVDIQNGHTLTVEAPTPWDMQTGSMVFTGGGTLAGMQMITRTSTCDIDVVSGTATFDASLYMEDGTLDVASGAGLRLNEHAHFFSDTALTFHGGSSTFLVYANTEINQSVFNWDAASSTLIAGSTLTINSAEISSFANDGYDGWMNVSGGTLVLNTTFEWAMEGTMNLNSGTVEGANIIVAGPYDDSAYVFAVTGASTINPSVQFDDGANLKVFEGAELSLASLTRFEAGADIVVDGTLNLNGATVYSGGTVTGNGTLFQNNHATVEAPTTIAVASIDLDGLGGSQWTLYHDLILNVGSIDSPGDGFDGTIEIPVSTSSLTVNLADPTHRWSIDSAGTVNFAGSGTIPVMIAGSDVEVAGTINVTNNGAITARTILSGTVNIQTAGSFFRFTGGDLVNTNALDGGTVNGPGKLYLPSGVALVGHGALNADIDFDGSAELLADNGVLEINGDIQDVGTIGTRSATGTLNVTNPWNTMVAGRLELNGGEVTGATITNDGTTTGHGMISTTQFHNNGTLSAAGGTMTIDTDSSPDLDGTGDGIVSAVDGDIVVVDPIFTTFSGSVTVGPGRTIDFQGGWSLSGDGILSLNGGPTHGQPARVDGGPMGVAARVIVDKQGIFDAPTYFWSQAQVSLPDAGDNLRLSNNAGLAAGATFSGAGDLAVAAGATLSLEDGAHVGVRLLNSGQTEIGFSIGAASVKEYWQSVTGTLVMEIDGVTPGVQHDQLIVNDDAEFSGSGPGTGGTLEIPVNDNGGSYSDPSDPGDLDQFQLLISSTLSGSFGQIVYDGVTLTPSFVSDDVFRSYQGEGLFRIVEYADSGVIFVNYRALAGDANGDLVVDVSDFNIWNANKFDSGDWTAGDFTGNGVVDVSDFNIWNANKFSTADRVSLVPEPGAWLLLTLAAAALHLAIRQWTGNAAA